MMILLAPAKRMRNDIAYLEAKQLPYFIRDSQYLSTLMKQKSIEELRHLLSCGERIAQEAHALFSDMDVKRNLTPALLAYDGIQYSYMAPDLFTEEELAYAQQHVRILSGFYGVLRPLDGVVPYRLEINSPLRTADCMSLYAYWGNRIYEHIAQEDPVILDLASAQYSRCIVRYKDAALRYVKCRFLEADGKEKGVYVKMARGEMVRFMAEHKIEHLSDMKAFDRLGYQFRESLSDEEAYVFMRRKGKQTR